MGRQTTKIRMWLLQQGIRQVEITRALQFTDSKTVWATIEGKENNRKVLSWLLANGCPEHYLGLPDTFRRTQ